MGVPQFSHERSWRTLLKLRKMQDQRELEIALDGKGAFRRFKNVLKDYPEVEKQWFKFKDEKDTEMVKEWLESMGIEMEED